MEFRVSLVLASIVFAVLGALLLAGATTVRQGEVESRLGAFRAKAVTAFSGSLLSLFAIGILVVALVNPLPARPPTRVPPERLSETEREIGELAREVKDLRGELEASRARMKEAPQPAGAAPTRARPAASAAPGKAAAVPALSLRVAGIMESRGRRLAVVEDPAGGGYIVQPGDAIGEGKVVEVMKGGIVVENARGERTTLLLAPP